MIVRRSAANANQAPDAAPMGASLSPRLLEWLARLTQPGFSLDILSRPFHQTDLTAVTALPAAQRNDDWQAITHICGYDSRDFASAGTALPLHMGEIDFFRRNHRGSETHASRDFLTAQTDLPSPLAELYGLYRHRARIDAEAALFLAQSTHTIRVARTMADLQAIGAFANGDEYVGYLGVTYSVPAAFDTSAEIDRANAEATRRLSLPADHPSHLLKMTPDELGVLAASIAERAALQPAEFLEKANLLSEARQDVNRLPPNMHYITAINEGDFPPSAPWTARLSEADGRRFPLWLEALPEV